MNLLSNSDENELDIIECICCWYDLLGFGAPFVESGWNLNSTSCKDQLKRIKNLGSSFTGYYTLNKSKSLSLNDGAIVNYDIIKSKKNLIREIVYLLDDIIQDFSSINYKDSNDGNPGARGIVTFGQRYHYAYSDTTVLVATEENVSYHPKEFQMNTAFSKAYLMEESGSKAGLKGNNLFFDNYLFQKLEKIILEKHGRESNFKTERKTEKDETHYTIYEGDIRLLKLKFSKDAIDFNQKGINTTIYKFLGKESHQDDMAYEAEYRRALALSEAEMMDDDD